MGADAAVEDEGHDGLTVKELREVLSKFDDNQVVIISARMPIDMDDPENAAMSPEELEEATTIEVGIDSVELIEYEDSEAKSVVGVFVDIAAVIEDDDDEEEDAVDDGEDE